MKIYKIEYHPDYEDNIKWDVVDAHIIICSDPIRCRVLASLSHGDEGSKLWLDHEKSIVSLIGETNELYDKEQILLTSFNAG